MCDFFDTYEDCEAQDTCGLQEPLPWPSHYVDNSGICSRLPPVCYWSGHPYEPVYQADILHLLLVR